MKVKNPVPITNRIRWSFFILILFMLLIYSIYSINHEFNSLNDELNRTITESAALFARDSRILAMLQSGLPDPETIAYLDSALESISRIDMLVVADSDSLRLYHPEKFRIGQPFVGEDEAPILAGAAPYITEGYGTLMHQRRAFHGVQDGDGNVVGFVMVSAYSANIKDMRATILWQGIGFFAGALLIGFILAGLLSRSIKRSLLGYEPDQITRLYLMNAEILESLEEGIMAVDSEGNASYTNAAAARMLERLGKDGKLALQKFVEQHMSAILTQGRAQHNKELALSKSAILADAIPIMEKGAQVGMVCILRDKAEQQRLAEQLTGVNHILTALRANSHEHINKLHVILGLLKMQDIDTAMEYIEHIKSEEEEDYGLVIQRIENKTIAALILGKKRNAKERNISLTLRKDSFLDSSNEHLSTSELVTIIGNLLENAMDAVEQTEGAGAVSLYIHSSAKGLVISVDDTGIGMSEREVEQIFAGGYTTKGKEHGIGLQLINEIMERYGSTLDIESEKGEGSSFTITFRKPPLEEGGQII